MKISSQLLEMFIKIDFLGKQINRIDLFVRVNPIDLQGCPSLLANTSFLSLGELLGQMAAPWAEVARRESGSEGSEREDYPPRILTISTMRLLRWKTPGLDQLPCAARLA